MLIYIILFSDSFLSDSSNYCEKSIKNQSAEEKESSILAKDIDQVEMNIVQGIKNILSLTRIIFEFKLKNVCCRYYACFNFLYYQQCF